MTVKTQVTDSDGYKVPRVFRPSTATKKTTGAIAGPYSHGDVVRVVFDADSWVKFGTTATGTAGITDTFMPDNHVEYFKIEGTYLYIAGTAGNMYCTLLV